MKISEANHLFRRNLHVTLTCLCNLSYCMAFHVVVYKMISVKELFSDVISQLFRLSL